MEQPTEANDNMSLMESEDARLRDIFEILNPNSQSPAMNGIPNPPEARTVTNTSNAAANNLPQSASLPLLGQELTQLQSPHISNSQIPATIQHKSVQRPFINIIEQPAAKAIRFRYECEGRSAGSIPGVNSTPENKTFPTIEIVGYKGDVVIVISCVTKDPPYRPHPHKLVGRDGCKDGICSLTLKGEPMRAVFSNLGVQCVKRKQIRSALELREKLVVDPFKTKFGHKDQPSSMDLNVVRLCFQAFIKTASGTKSLTPVVTDPIYDRKAMSDLVICRLCSCAAKVLGGDEVILLCEKVTKDDIKVKFFELNKEKQVVWEDYAEFQQTDIHKQTAIAFKTPRYHNTDIVDRAKVFLQLVRPSDGEVSEAVPFEYHPDPGMRTFSRIRHKLKRKEDLEIFQQILSFDSETTATKYSCPPTDVEAENDDIETVSSDSSASKPRSTDTLNGCEEAVKRQTSGETDGADEPERARDMEIELEVPLINYPAADESTQTSTPMEEILKHQQLGEPRQISAVDKITEWMRSSEFERTDSLTVENGDGDGDLSSLSPVTVYTNVTNLSANNHTTISTATDEDKTFTDLMEQVAELDDILAESLSRRGTLENPIIQELPLGGSAVADIELPQVIDEFLGSASAQASLDNDEISDETATYTSLQRAFKNPVDMSNKIAKQSRQLKNTTLVINDEDGLVVLNNPPAPKIRVNAAQTPPSPPSPTLPLIPPRTPSPVPDQQLPPLPPKRKASQELSSADPTPSTSMEHSRNGSLSSRPPSQIIIMRTPDQSPTKRQPTPACSPKKKQSFFSRFFSRRKSSKVELNPSDETSCKAVASKATSPLGSREPSVGHFSLSDPNRSSLRSAKSAQLSSAGLSPQSSIRSSKNGKPVGRSVSSVSSKRPAHLNADVIHIPLKGDGSDSYSNATAITFGHQFDRKTLSALHLADIPICDGNMELVAIADRQSIKNLCEGSYGVILDAGVDLAEAEHFALYTSLPPACAGDCEENSIGADQSESNTFLTPDDIARRLAEANDQIKRKRLKMGASPMNILRRELQRHDQLQNQQVQNDFRNISASGASNFWNTPILSEIKPEPAMSPQHFGPHRSPYQMSPSPQPLSPLNRNATPSPGLLKTPSAGSQTQMCELMNYNSLKDSLNSPPAYGAQYNNVVQSNNNQNNNNNGNANAFMQSADICDQNNFVPLANGNANGNGFNPFVDMQSRAPRMSGGSITPIWPANSNTTGQQPSLFLGMNIVAQQIPVPQQQYQQQQYQQQQQPYQQQQYQQQQYQQFQQLPNDIDILANVSNLEEGPTLSGLLAMVDADQLMQINSDDLPLSNLSITT